MNSSGNFSSRLLALPILSPARNRLLDLFENCVRDRVTRSLQLRPIIDQEENDFHVIGFPKSGHTWMQYLLAGLVYGLDVENAPNDLVQDLVVDSSQKAYYKRYRSPFIFKSHKLPDNKVKKVIYLLRDGRDASLSFYHHLNVTSPGKFTLRQVFLNEGIPMCPWAAHVEAWLTNPFDAEIFFLHYEDLKNDGLAQGQRLCTFLGIIRSTAEIECAFSKASFDKMRSREERLGWGDREKAWKNNKRFCRKGEVGSFRKEVDESLVKEFNERFGSTLQKVGYLL